MSRYGPERKIARGEPCDSASFGLLEEHNRRFANARSDELFLAAQRRYELSLAATIETELCGGLPPEIHAERVIKEVGLTAFERAMERVKAGAGIVEIRPISRADPTMTLGGVSPALY